MTKTLLELWSAEVTIAFTKTVGVAPGRWMQMEQKLGPTQAAKEILSPRPESWWAPILFHLQQHGLLHTSVEALALSPVGAPVFTDAEKTEARKPLEALDYDWQHEEPFQDLFTRLTTAP